MLKKAEEPNCYLNILECKRLFLLLIFLGGDNCYLNILECKRRSLKSM